MSARIEKLRWPGRGDLPKLVVVLLLCAFGVVLLRTAWVCDDAYITFRTIDNFLNGLGLVWNKGERVQAFTHPLWLFCLALFGLVTGEQHFTSIFFSIACSLAAAAILADKISSGRIAGALALLALLLSRSFIDFSTSGLENPLTNLLLALFFLVYFKQEERGGGVTIPALIASLVALNRLDAILLVAPPLAWLLLKNPDKFGKKIAGLLLGFTPLILWELFSLFYYGFPFPNTAYAKLGAGIPAADLLARGLDYFRDVILHDSITPAAIAFAGTAAALKAKKAPREAMAALGAGLYLLYILKIGGDFMSGRFFTAPLFVSAVLISRFEFKSRWVPLAAACCAIFLGFLVARPTLTSGADYSVPTWNMDWIADERGVYFPHTGLLRKSCYFCRPKHHWINQGLAMRNNHNQVVVIDCIGMAGYYAGPEVYLIDRFALTDPLRARIPLCLNRNWRSGHLAREFPLGYAESLAWERNMVKAPEIAEYFGKLIFVIRGPLFDFNRLKEIWLMNTGAYPALPAPECPETPKDAPKPPHTIIIK